MGLEQRFLAALETTRAYRFDRPALVLLEGERILARLTAETSHAG